MRTLDQVGQAVAGTQVLEFRWAENDEGRDAWIASLLRRFDDVSIKPGIFNRWNWGVFGRR